jgi:CRP-like cAMP-binding protein
MHQITARGLQTAYQRMLLLTQKSADERVAWFLLELAERSQTKDGALHLPMSRTDIADYLGMVIETVSRALSRLKRAGTIVMQTVNDVRLVDRRQLELVRGEI